MMSLEGAAEEGRLVNKEMDGVLEAPTNAADYKEEGGGGIGKGKIEKDKPTETIISSLTDAAVSAERSVKDKKEEEVVVEEGGGVSVAPRRRQLEESAFESMADVDSSSSGAADSIAGSIASNGDARDAGNSVGEEDGVRGGGGSEVAEKESDATLPSSSARGDAAAALVL